MPGYPCCCQQDDVIPTVECVNCGDDIAASVFTVTIAGMTNATGTCNCPGSNGVYELPFLDVLVAGSTTVCRWLLQDGPGELFPSCTGGSSGEDQQVLLQFSFNSSTGQYARSVHIRQGLTTLAIWLETSMSDWECLVEFTIPVDTESMCNAPVDVTVTPGTV